MKPKRILIMRHAESIENVDKTIYASKSDLDIDLTMKGKNQAKIASSKISEIISNGSIHFYISPGTRLKKTYDIVTNNFPRDLSFSFTVETLLIKQFWGDITVESRRDIEIQRYKEGTLVYRFPNGESGGQLLQRFQFFIDALRKDFEKEDFPENIAIITHGFEMRVFLKVWFGWSIPYFETLANPQNCEIIVLSLNTDGSYSLDRELRIYDPNQNPFHIEKKVS